LVFQAGDVQDLAAALAAAPSKFSDLEHMGRQCLHLIAAFSPEAAANEILSGCKKMLSCA
jgi:hypothetical protein